MSLAAVAVSAWVITLAAQAPQTPPGGGRGGSQFPPPSRGGGGGGGAAGPADKPLVDFALAEKGKDVWIAECVTCHGAQARGTDNGPNLLRSLVFLRDRYGSEIGPFLKKGHQLQSGKPASSLTDEQITNIAHFLRKQLNDTLRGAAAFTVQDILSGDAKAGAAYFNGDRQVRDMPLRHWRFGGPRRQVRNRRHSAAHAFPGGGRGGATRRTAAEERRAGYGHAAGGGMFRSARLYGRFRRHAAGCERRVAHVQADAGTQGAENRSARRRITSCSNASPTRTSTISSRIWRP